MLAEREKEKKDTEEDEQRKKCLQIRGKLGNDVA
jgi:hypothetical protein